MMCAYRECGRSDTEEVTLGLVSPEGERSDETTYLLCPEHRDLILHRVVSAGRPPFDEAGA